MCRLVQQDVAHRAQFAGIAVFAQDARRRIAAPVGEGGEVHLDEAEPAKMRQQDARIVARFDPHGQALVCSAKASTVTAGSATGSSSR
jgi:hypothetical protein